jgi:hypothetical protein
LDIRKTAAKRLPFLLNTVRAAQTRQVANCIRLSTSSKRHEIVAPVLHKPVVRIPTFFSRFSGVFRKLIEARKPQ